METHFPDSNFSSHISLSAISEMISGELSGPDNVFTGVFNTLGDSNEGDIVIRHWINGEGIKIASSKGVSGIITQDPRDNAMETAIEHGISLIVVEKIEIANSFALKWTIQKFAPKSRRVVVTGTNGKSTTTHMIYHILKRAKWNVYTNTDSKSEFNTLIDPMVAKQISEFAINLKGLKNDSGLNESSEFEIRPDDISDEKKIDALIIEVSEVQGWLDKVMKGHAYLMTKAIDPQVVVITNVAMDHIGLVNSIDEAFDEINGAVKAIQSGFVVLNFNDSLVKKMKASLNENVTLFCHGNNCPLEFNDESGGILFNGNLIIKTEELPFKSQHFIENTLSAISACITLDVDMEDIVNGVVSYHALNRRFSLINENPTIIDDFAHNPDGIKATIESAAEISLNKSLNNSSDASYDVLDSAESSKLWVVCSIRGSRGDEINHINSQALAESLNALNLDYGLIVSSSSDVVDNLNIVKNHEKEIFLKTLNSYKIDYLFEESLKNSLKTVLSKAKPNDTILLIGAQGMDPALDLLQSL